MGVPQFLPARRFTPPRVGDRVTEEQQVDIAFLRDFDKAFVTLDPGGVARNWHDGGVGVGTATECGSDGQQKRESKYTRERGGHGEKRGCDRAGEVRRIRRELNGST